METNMEKVVAEMVGTFAKINLVMNASEGNARENLEYAKNSFSLALKSLGRFISLSSIGDVSLESNVIYNKLVEITKEIESYITFFENNSISIESLEEALRCVQFVIKSLTPHDEDVCHKKGHQRTLKLGKQHNK